MKLLLFLTLFLTLINCKAQEILLEEDVRDLYDEYPERGPNLKHFHHFHIDYLLFIKDKQLPQFELKIPASRTFAMGWRYKRRFNDFVAVGVGANYRNQSFLIKQNNQNNFPDTLLHDKEKIKFNTLDFEIFNRINFRKRGNTIGFFLDLGVYAGYNLWVKHVTYDEYEEYSENKSKSLTTINQNLKYINYFSYGTKARLGYNRYVLSACYRFSDLIKKDFKAKLPPLSIGFEIGIF